MICPSTIFQYIQHSDFLYQIALHFSVFETGSPYIVQDILELTIFLPQPLKT